jgi:hypothetical protein
MSSIG